MSIKIEYRNRLPHIAPIGAAFFVTFRLADALPAEVLRRLTLDFKQKKEKLLKSPSLYSRQKLEELRWSLFRKVERQLDHEYAGKCYLQEEKVAQTLLDRLKQYDGQLYELQAYCIMPNHVHLLISLQAQIVDDQGFYLAETPKTYVQLHKIMQLIKGGSAYLINKHLGRSGPLWAKDSYDRYMRNGKEWENTVQYIIENPVKAGLVKRAEDWTFSFVAAD
jgi:REP element-mobilizing transposase RayT